MYSEKKITVDKFNSLLALRIEKYGKKNDWKQMETKAILRK